MIKYLPLLLLLTACDDQIEPVDDSNCFLIEGATEFYENCLADTGLPEQCEYATDKAFCEV